MPANTKPHGGARRGAGRPRKYGIKLKLYGIRITPDHAALYRRLGNGNLSEGVRRAAEMLPADK